jgi:choline dehydrogenase-like flavoprotein
VILTGAQATPVILAGLPGQRSVRGVKYRTAPSESATIHDAEEVILSADAVGSPKLLRLSGIGPR